MSVLKKIKKNSHLLTNEELENLEREMYRLQDECISLSAKTPTRENLIEIAKRGKRLKSIKKILLDSKKNSEKVGL